MMLFFLILMSFFALTIFYLVRQTRRQQEQFSQRMQNLRGTLAQLSQASLAQGRKLQLNEELEQTLKTRKPQLGQMLFHLNFDLFQMLSDHQLLR